MLPVTSDAIGFAAKCKASLRPIAPIFARSGRVAYPFNPLLLPSLSLDNSLLGRS